MSDSKDSTVTYNTVSSPYEWRSGDVSPGVDGPSVMPNNPYAYVVAAFQALPPPDYVPGPEEPEQAPPLPVYIPYVPEPSPGYIPESDPDEDPEEDDDEDPEEDPADYPADHDDEEEEPSGDDADEDDEEKDEDDDDDEEEHPALADSIPPPPALLAVAARLIEGRRADYGFVNSVEAEIRRRRAEDIGYGIRDIWMDPRDDEDDDDEDEEHPASADSIPPALPSPPILPIPLPAASPPLQLLSSDHGSDRPEVTLPPRKMLSIVHCPRYEAGESSVVATARLIEGRRAGYGFVDSGHLVTALGEIRALQAREQARAGAPEGASSST
nr:hypothetical protein [Tanacetum cinerariifolium]